MCVCVCVIALSTCVRVAVRDVLNGMKNMCVNNVDIHSGEIYTLQTHLIFPLFTSQDSFISHRHRQNKLRFIHTNTRFFLLVPARIEFHRARSVAERATRRRDGAPTTRIHLGMRRRMLEHRNTLHGIL
jgi:hypothetical protein